MAQQVEVSLSIEGEKISPFSSISITQEIHQHHTFEIQLPADAFENTTLDILQKSKEYPGKKILIQFGVEVFAKKHPNNEFIGIITQIGVTRGGNGEKNVFIIGASPTLLLDGINATRSFTEKSLNEIADAMLEKIPTSLETTIQLSYSKPIPYVVQYYESNYSFFQRLARDYGEWFFYDGRKLVIGKLPRDKVIDLPFNEDLSDLSFFMSLSPAINKKAIGYNYLENKVYESSSSAYSVSNLDAFGQSAVDKSAKSFPQEPIYYSKKNLLQQKDLDDIVETDKGNVARKMVQVFGNSDNPYINVGTVIDIKGESVKEHDFGKFIVTSLVHNISDANSYNNSFTAIPAELQSPPPAEFISEPSGEPELAVITDNEDPEGLGRVKAKLFWQTDNETTPWIRVAQTMAGQGRGKVHGFYFIPEIDDEVMVGFENNNPDMPFVMGSLYHINVTPSDWQDQDNNVKVIRTKSGNEIFITDKDGSEEIKILNKDAGDPTNFISLSMEGNGKITIETKGDMVFKAKSISMKADDGIKIESGKATELKVNEMKVNAADKISMKSQQLKIDSTNASVKANGKLEIEGTQSDIKAQMLKIDGGATASVKAAIIQLN